MIKAIFFDFDGVLTTDKSGSLTTLRSLSRQTLIPEETLWDAFSPFNHDLLNGNTTHAEVWPEICRALGKPIPSDLLEIAFLATPINQSMMELAKELRKSRRTGIITDNKADRVASLSRHHTLGALFEPIVVSAEFGSGKDQPDIFLHALDCLALAPAEAIFIDNTRKNLVAPSGIGMKTLYFDDETNDVKALRIAIDELCATANV